MKRYGLLTVLLMAVVITALSGCSGKDAGTSDGNAQTTDAAAETTVATAATTADALYPATGYCNGSTLYVRPEPNKNDDNYPIGGLKYGEEVRVLGKEGDWYMIDFPPADGGVAYVSALYIQFDIPSADGGTTEDTGTTASGTTSTAA